MNRERRKKEENEREERNRRTREENERGRRKKGACKVLPSKLDWFPSTIEAFWEKNGRLWIFNALWNLT